MTRTANSTVTPRTLWRRLRKLVARRMESLQSLRSPGEHSHRSSPAGNYETEVFPWMEHAILAGAILGSVVALALGQSFHLALSSLALLGSLGLTVGVVAGVCLGLSRAVAIPADPAANVDLWDPWLDGRGSPHEDDPELTPPVEDADAETLVEFNHWRARVRPRVLSPVTGESLPLTEVVGPILEDREFVAIRLLGPSGWGKTTALNHLAGLMPPHLKVSFLDEPDPSAVVKVLSKGRVVYTSNKASLPSAPVTDLRLAPWGEDEWIEYLLAGDQRRCISVMARLVNVKAEAATLDGIPELWRLVLDRMMADPSVHGPRSALRNELDTRLSDAELRREVEAACFHAAFILDGERRRPVLTFRLLGPDKQVLLRITRHRPVQLLLAADCIARAINQGDASEALACDLPRDLVVEAAVRIADDPAAVDRVRSFITEGDRRIQPMAASLLHALRIGWKPNVQSPRLAGAYLEKASWAKIDLTGADLRGADLGGANLSDGLLGRANIANANLVGCSLCDANMEEAIFDKADLSRASLPQVRAELSRFVSAQLVAANLVRANLGRAVFLRADLTDAQLADASLVKADLRSAKLEGADFSRADLSGAIMRGLTLAGAQFTGARFTGANLSQCDLEGMQLPDAAFGDANLSHALLTASCMPGADFRGANLRAAGLAEIDWEGVDLRGADLREAAFHLGSSRSGLVGSPIACEGSRTGFYTDDFTEQEFKSPEEIRKANLCGADLRGARIDDVDFYLVDLRGALLDPDQIPHIRRCGAILETRSRPGSD